jgi:hypothetical protein
MKLKASIVGLLASLAATSALAQGTGAFNLEGSVAAVTATSISVTPDGGGAPTVFKLDPKYIVVQNKPATLADIKPDDFIASAAVHGTDGKLHSTELRIFPAAMRGQGEGQRPMTGPGDRVMTNALVTGTAIMDGSNHIKVKLDGGDKDLTVDPGIPVVRIDTVDRSLVRPGAHVRVQGVQNADGATVSRISVQ